MIRSNPERRHAESVALSGFVTSSRWRPRLPVSEASPSSDGALMLAATVHPLGITLYTESRCRMPPTPTSGRFSLRPMTCQPITTSACSCRLRGKLDEAIAHYRNALRFDSRHADSHHGLALAFRSQGKAAESVRHYREALQAVPDWPDVLIDLAWLLATAANPSVRNPQEAVQVAEGAVRSAPLSWQALDASAVALASAQRFEEATERAGVRSISQSRRATMKPPVRFASASASMRGAFDNRPSPESAVGSPASSRHSAAVRPLHLRAFPPHIDAALGSEESSEVSGKARKAAGGPRSPEASGTPGLPSLCT